MLTTYKEFFIAMMLRMCQREGQTPLLTPSDDTTKHRSGVGYTVRMLDGTDMEVEVPV